MKPSFTTMACPDWSGIQAVLAAKNYGYRGVDLRVASNRGELTNESSHADVQELKRTFDSEGIIPASLLGYNKNGNEEGWQRMYDTILRLMELAHEIGAPLARIFPGSARNSEEYEHDEFMARTRDVLECVIANGPSDVTLIIQNHRKHMTALESVKLIEMVGLPRLGMVFSPEHCRHENENMRRIYQAIVPHIRQLYIADTKAGGEDVLPGKGDVPILETIDTVRKSGFDGWLTFKWEKIWNRDIEEPEVALPYFIQYMEAMNVL